MPLLPGLLGSKGPQGRPRKPARDTALTRCGALRCAGLSDGGCSKTASSFRNPCRKTARIASRTCSDGSGTTATALKEIRSNGRQARRGACPRRAGAARGRTVPPPPPALHPCRVNLLESMTGGSSRALFEPSTSPTPCAPSRQCFPFLICLHSDHDIDIDMIAISNCFFAMMKNKNDDDAAMSTRVELETQRLASRVLRLQLMGRHGMAEQPRPGTRVHQKTPCLTPQMLRRDPADVKA